MPPDNRLDYEVGWLRHAAPPHALHERPIRQCARATKRIEKPADPAERNAERAGHRRREWPPPEEISKRRAIITQLVNRSAKGDLRALKILLDILQEIERRTEPASPETSSFSEADKKVIAQLESRLQGKR
jgi:hypothetical protein